MHKTPVSGEKESVEMEMTAREFLAETGLKEPLAPGQMKVKKHPGKNPSTSYTMIYDWKTDPDKIRVELRPGLSGQMPDKKELSKYALWLQAETFWELDMSHAKTKH